MKKTRMLLRVIRAAHEPKLTQNVLAKAAGLSTSRFWQIEHGEGVPPRPHECKAIAKVLGVRVEDIAWPEVYERSIA